MNVCRLLAEHAQEWPERPALVTGGGRKPADSVTFGQLWQRIDRLSTGLRHAGLEADERVILMVPMSVELYALLLAVLKTGAVAVFVDPWMPARRVAAFSAFARPRGFIGVGKAHLLRLWHGGLRRLPLTVTTGVRFGPWPARWSVSDLMRQSGDGEITARDGADAALITFTSGSSGTPKGANRTHGFLLAQHHALQEQFPYADDDIDMSMFPVFALNNLARGITTVVPEMDFRDVAAVDGGAILAQLRRHGVSTCTASPPFIDRLCARLTDVDDRAPALRRVLSGGAPITDRQLESWIEHLPGTEIQVVYGSTEAEPVAHISAASRLARRQQAAAACPGFCAGPPVAAIDCRVIRIASGPVHLSGTGWQEWLVPPGEIGELIVAGDHVCRDYFSNPEAVRENKIIDAAGRCWHRMGDTGYLDADGCFWLVGRVHSTIIRDGQAVHPQLVEQAVAGVSGLRRCAAVGLPDAHLGERVVLVAEAAADAGLRQRLERQLAAVSTAVDQIIVRGTPLPLDPRHRSKVDYGLLRAELSGNRDTEREGVVP